MRLITISNLYPRPDKPIMGMFNFQMFREMERILRSQESGVWIQNKAEEETRRYLNICLVPSWKIWQWPAIRHWKMPAPAAQLSVNGYPLSGNTANNKEPITNNSINSANGTVYVPIFYLPFIGRSINWWFYYRALRDRVIGYEISVIGNTNNKELLTNNSEDGASCAILASWLYPDAVAGARLARELGLPVWLRVHGTDRYHMNNPHRRKLILDAVTYARGVICNCRAVADDLAKYGIPGDKIHIVPNGVDTSLFRWRSRKDLLSSQVVELLRGQEHRGNGLNNFTTEQLSNSQLILFIGNLVPIKGPDVLLRAFAALGTPAESVAGCHVAELPPSAHEKVIRCSVAKLLSEETSDTSSTTQQPNNSTTSRNNSTTVLLIIGSGPMMAQLKRMTKDLGIADRVHFLGSLPHDKVALWMNRADVLCSTSRSEGMPNVVVEAVASGLPVVATAVGGTPEVLTGEPTARVCQSEDVCAIAAALKEVLGMSVDRPALAARFAHYYSWNRQAAELLRLMSAS